MKKTKKQPTIKSRIEKLFGSKRAQKNGLTVREIADRLGEQFAKAGMTPPPYSSIRGRTYELVDERGYFHNVDSGKIFTNV